MAFTKSQLEALKNALLASNQPITAPIHREFAQKIIDELYDAQSRANLLSAIQNDSSLLTTDSVFVIRNGQGFLIPSSQVGGTGSLANLTDTVIIDPQEGEVLGYNSVTGKWVNQNAGLVNTVFGRAGDVVAESGDYSQFYLPLTGGTLASSGSTNTLDINHASGSGLALNITKAGNGEGLKVVKTSGSGNAATFIGTVESTAFVVTGGTGNQVLRADGSLDDTLISAAEVYAKFVQSASPFTTGFIPKIFNEGGTGYFLLNSLINDNGTNVSVGHTTNPNSFKLDVNGTARFTNNIDLISAGGATGRLQSGTSAISLFTTSSADVSIGTNNLVRVIVGANGTTQFAGGIAVGGYTPSLSHAALFNGNVGIGTTENAGFKLDVNGTGRFSGQLTSGTTTAGNINAKSFLIGIDGTETNYRWQAYLGGSDAFNLSSRNFGDVLSISYTTGAATFSSSVTATSFITSSDKRKKDIISQDGELATYRFKGDDQIHYGYIAQDMQGLYPNQVSTDNDGMMSLNYIEILVKKVHDLEKEIKLLKNH